MDIVGISMNVTERVQIETEIRQSRHRLEEANAFLEAVLDEAPVGLCIFDTGLRYLRINDALARINGLPVDAHIGRALAEVLGPERAGIIEPLLRRVLEQGETIAGLELSGPDGYFLTDIYPVRTSDGVMVGVGATVTDITERRQAEEALRESEARFRELSATLEARVAERTEELAQSREQLRELSAYVIRAREDERARIAREVHDEFGGTLTVLKMSLARTSPGREDDADLSTRLHDIHLQIDNLVNLVRRIASDLRPPILDDFGLVAALEWQAQEWTQRTGIPCKLDVSLFSESLQVAQDIRTAVFRAFQESLTNVARHAQASRVAATLELDGDTLLLTVQDNGRGIDPATLKAGKSMGLLGMRERMREVGGSLDVISAPGKGATIRIMVPLRTVPLRALE